MRRPGPVVDGAEERLRSTKDTSHNTHSPAAPALFLRSLSPQRCGRSGRQFLQNHDAGHLTDGQDMCIL